MSVLGHGGYGRERNFVSPIRTTPWGSIKSPADFEAPSAAAMKSQQLAHEPAEGRRAAVALSRSIQARIRLMRLNNRGIITGKAAY